MAQSGDSPAGYNNNKKRYSEAGKQRLSQGMRNLSKRVPIRYSTLSSSPKARRDSGFKEQEQREGKAQEMPEENKSQVPKPETEIEGKSQAVQAPSIPPPIKLEASTLRREELAEELARDPMH
ncbi:hypothetical protein ACFE04_019668 [Oxalis oulophora]